MEQQPLHRNLQEELSISMRRWDLQLEQKRVHAPLPRWCWRLAGLFYFRTPFSEPLRTEWAWQEHGAVLCTEFGSKQDWIGIISDISLSTSIV
jgi:hypothetical protein